MFGSGTLAGAETWLSRFVLVDPLMIAAEERELEALGIEDPTDKMTVDRRALVTTPIHAEANRREEIRRGKTRHGSCGRGIGKTREYAIAYPDDALTVDDLFKERITAVKLELLAERLGIGKWSVDIPEIAGAYKRFTQAVWTDNGDSLNGMLNSFPAVFEGAQGVLLDESWGFPPYHTWTDTTSRNALQLLTDAGLMRSSATVLGLTRSYATRHGAGPFPTESESLTLGLPDEWNEFNEWQRDWRVGYLDLVALRYAIKACGDAVDKLGVTCLDRASVGNACTAYVVDGDVTQDIPQADTAFMERAAPIMTRSDSLLLQIEEYLDVPVELVSRGPTAADKTERTAQITLA